VFAAHVSNWRLPMSANAIWARRTVCWSNLTPSSLFELRQAIPHTWFLVPGYAARRTSADVLCLECNGLGAIGFENALRIIFAHERPE